MVNDLVALMGASFLHRIARETAQPIADVTTAWFVASEISGAATLREQLSTMEGALPAETLYRWEFGLARVLERTTRWVLTSGHAEGSVEQLAQRLTEGLSSLRGEFGTFVSGEDRAVYEQILDELKGIAEPELAQRLVTLRFLPELLDILQLARELSFEPIETARAFYLVSERQGIDWLQRLRRSVPQKEGWERRLALHLGSDLHGAQRDLTRDTLRCHREGSSIEECLATIERDRTTRQESYRVTLEELRKLEQPTLAALAVGVRALRELAEE
jgi:glutamate dehydrogenase